MAVAMESNYKFATAALPEHLFIIYYIICDSMTYVYNIIIILIVFFLVFVCSFSQSAICIFIYYNYIFIERNIFTHCSHLDRQVKEKI